MTHRVFRSSLGSACIVAFLLAGDYPAVAQSPADHESHLRIAEQQFQQGKLDDAAKSLRALADAHPEDPQPHWYLGVIAYQQSRHLEARDHFRALVERQEEAGAGWAMLGLSEFRLKEFDEALPHLELGRFLGIASNDALAETAALHQAFLCNRIGRFDVALGVLSELAVQGRKSAGIVAAFGIAALNKPWLLEDVPHDQQPLIMEAGEAAWLLGARRQQEASHLAETLLRKYPTQPGLHFIFGTTLVRADWDRAEAELRIEVQTNPSHYYAHLTLASELTDRGRAADAVPFANHAASLRPDSHIALGLLGKALLGAQRAEEAVPQLEEAVKLAPQNANVRYSLALAYARVGRKEDSARQREIFAQLQQAQTAPSPRVKQ
ncbi:MAG: tetratricopeptide repeat protein [Bryobacterales bacterium]|nr:tetratricopeptide repeat protein [Bryobacterales bacterium]